MTRRALARIAAVFVGAAIVAAMAFAASPASAAFPGQNGKIAFTSVRDPCDFDTVDIFEIYVMNADGSGQTRLTNSPGYDQEPAFSADGTKIAFTSSRDGNKEIYVMNADGSGQTRLTWNLADEQEPTFSPDGTRIAFASFRDSNFEIYVMNADGSGQTRLTSDPAFDSQPAFSSDGTKIAFASGRSGSVDIHVMNADGSGPTRLTSEPAVDALPTFSPNGAKIAFVSQRAGNPQIYVMNADGSGQTQLTWGSFASQPAFSPDGSKIAFRDGRHCDAEIYTMNADGSGQPTPLTTNAAYDGGPDWGRVPGPALSVSDVSGAEGDLVIGVDGLHFFLFTVRLSSPSATEVLVAVETRDDTATEGSDYGGTVETLIFAPGETSKVVAVQVIGDDLYEGNERFFVELNFSFGALVADARGVGTIVNDDAPPPSLSISDVSGSEGDPATTPSGLQAFFFTVSLSSPSAIEVSVDVETRDYTASDGSDYIGTSGRIIFAPGETSKVVAVDVIADELYEADERFFVELKLPFGASLADPQGVGRILNDDPRDPVCEKKAYTPGC